MKLTMLYKDPGSGGRDCPSVYLADNGDLVIQGQLVDPATADELANVLSGEGAVRISPEIVAKALERYSSTR